MRSMDLSFFQNTGDTTVGNTLVLTGRLVSVGEISHTVDDQLTKVIPGDLTITVEDFDEALWTFLQTSIQVSTGVLPPFVLLSVAGTRKFLGIVQLDKIGRPQDQRVVSFTAQDWSVMLTNSPLEGAAWQRALPRAVSSRPAPSTQVCESVLYRGPLKSQPQFRQFITWPYPNAWGVAEGDFVSASDIDIDTNPPWTAGPWKLTNVGRVYTGANGDVPTNLMGAVPAGFNWDPYHGSDGTNCDATFSVVKLADLSNGYYKVTTAFTPDPKVPKYVIPLDTVDGIVPGDTMKFIGDTRSGTWTILSVDAERKEVTTKQVVSTELLVGDRLAFTEEALGQLVFEDAEALLRRAALPYPIDTTRFKPAVFDDPVFAWLPLRGKGEDLAAVADLEAGLTDLRVFGNDSRSWDGTPEAGWTRGGVTTKRAGWTDQLTSPPSSQMPYEVPSLAPNTRFRNRKYDSFDTYNVNNGGGSYDPASTADIVVVVYDYLQMRRVDITGTSCAIRTWNGSSFGSPSTVAWPSSNKVKSACVYPGLPGAILGVTPTTVELAFAGSLQSVALPSGAKNPVAVCTPWAAFIVGANGYGRVTSSGGSLSVAWVDLTGEVNAFWPNTFAAIDGDTCFMLGRFDAVDDVSGEKATETWALYLAAQPTTVDASVLDAERILEGSPALVGAFRDPSKPGRIVGQVAGALFQVSRELPTTIERFHAVGMSALECIEHICQVHNAIAIPNPAGRLEVVSRMYFDAPYAVTVDQVSVQQTRSFPDFYTVVRVSTSDDKAYWDAYGQDGGRYLEINQHPMVWSQSQCKAMASSYALWFGQPRAMEEQAWFHTNPDTAPPWDALPRYAKVTLNGGSTQQRIVKLSEDLVQGVAKVTLVSTEFAGYGLQYGRGRD